MWGSWSAYAISMVLRFLIASSGCMRLKVSRSTMARAPSSGNTCLQTTQHGPRMARRPLHGHFLMPVQGNAFECASSDNRFGLSLLLGCDRINAFRQHPLSLQTLLSSICETDDKIIAKRGQPIAPVRFHIPEAPAFAATGVNEEVKAVTVKKLVGAVSRFGRTMRCR